MEDEREPFNVRNFLDRPEVIEAYIGDLQVEIERLRQKLKDQSPGHLAHTVDPEILG